MRIMLAITTLLVLVLAMGCRVKDPGRLEEALATELKKTSIGGKDWKNPAPDDSQTVKTGAEHFQHHCAVCHGLDGQSTGVPFAEKMSPPVANLKTKDVQDYTDGQLKWIIENGLRFTGMPAWKGILEEEEMWSIVRYLRHLPEKGSLGIPAVYREAEEKHKHSGHEHSHDEHKH